LYAHQNSFDVKGSLFPHLIVTIEKGVPDVLLSRKLHEKLLLDARRNEN